MHEKKALKFLQSFIMLFQETLSIICAMTVSESLLQQIDIRTSTVCGTMCRAWTFLAMNQLFSVRMEDIPSRYVREPPSNLFTETAANLESSETVF